MQVIGNGIPIKRRELEALYVACSVALQEKHLSKRSRSDYEALHKRLLHFLENSQATEYVIQPTWAE